MNDNKLNGYVNDGDFSVVDHKVWIKADDRCHNNADLKVYWYPVIHSFEQLLSLQGSENTVLFWQFTALSQRW